MDYSCLARAATAAGVLLSLAAPAGATPCGQLRRQAAHLKGAQAVAKEAAGLLRGVEKKLAAECAPKRATIAALPLAYVSMPRGNLSKATFRPGDEWGLTLTTRAGAAHGLVLPNPAELELPSGWQLETALDAHRDKLDHLVAVALGAELTVEETDIGRGVWKITVKNPPVIVPMSKIHHCASGKPDPALKGLNAAACKSLAAIDPTPQPGSVPGRGRAVLVAEWQYGWARTIELGDDELAELPDGDGAAPRLDVALELSAPLPGLSDGKVLHVSFEANRQRRPAGATLKLGNGCGDDDDACEKLRFGAEVWYDRIFGVPFLRKADQLDKPAAASGKVTDRLARPVGGQRLLLTAAGGRRIITITDERGEYRFDDLPGGEATLMPVGKNPNNVAKGTELRRILLGTSEAKVPVTYVNKLWE